MQSPFLRSLTTLMCPDAIREDRKLEKFILLCGDVLGHAVLGKKEECHWVDGLIM